MLNDRGGQVEHELAGVVTVVPIHDGVVCSEIGVRDRVVGGARGPDLGPNVLAAHR